MNSGLYKEPRFSTLSRRLANQIIIPQPAAGPSRSAVRFSVQILAWEDCEWLSLLLGLSCSRLISCSYPVIFGWLFISILGYNPHHKPRTWQLCEISAWNKHVVLSSFSRATKFLWISSTDESYYVSFYAFYWPAASACLMLTFLRCSHDNVRSALDSANQNQVIHSGSGQACFAESHVKEKKLGHFQQRSRDEKGLDFKFHQRRRRGSVNMSAVTWHWHECPFRELTTKTTFRNDTSRCYLRGRAHQNHSRRMVSTWVFLWSKCPRITVSWSTAAISGQPHLHLWPGPEQCSRRSQRRSPKPETPLLPFIALITQQPLVCLPVIAPLAEALWIMGDDNLNTLVEKINKWTCLLESRDVWEVEQEIWRNDTDTESVLSGEGRQVWSPRQPAVPVREPLCHGTSCCCGWVCHLSNCRTTPGDNDK